MSHVDIAIEVAGSLLTRLTWSEAAITPAKYRPSSSCLRGAA